MSVALDATQNRADFPMCVVAGCASVCICSHSNELLMPCCIVVAIAANAVIAVVAVVGIVDVVDVI